MSEPERASIRELTLHLEDARQAIRELEAVVTELEDAHDVPLEERFMASSPPVRQAIESALA